MKVLYLNIPRYFSQVFEKYDTGTTLHNINQDQLAKKNDYDL